MNGFRDFLATQLQRIGWREFVRRSGGEFTHGAVQGWLRGALPGPGHQIVIASITGASVATIRDLVWQSERAREEERLSPAPFRPRVTGRGANGAEAPRPRREQPPAVARRVLAHGTKTANRSGRTRAAAPTGGNRLDRRPLIGRDGYNPERWIA